MNKAELVEEVAGKVGLTKKETNNVVDAITSAITEVPTLGQHPWIQLLKASVKST